MNIVITVVSIAIIAVGIFVNRNNFSFQRPTASPEIQEETVQEIEDEVLPTPSASPTLIPETDEERVSEESDLLSSLIYQDSSQVSLQSNKVVLESPDNPEVITEWYEERMQEEGMNVRSSVSTETNGEVLNKISAADGEREIDVEISKQPDSETTNISVEVSIN